jgi:hypothetical protein
VRLKKYLGRAGATDARGPRDGFMRSITAAIAFVILATPAFAVAPQYWTVDSPDDFLAGEIEGFAVTARGSLVTGPPMTRVASVSDPFVLSQTAGDGARFVGTGNAGRVYRLSGNEIKPLYTAPEPEIYALAFHNGALFVASSPNGKIYRVDPRSGQASEYFDPKEAYIWAISVLPDGSMAAATGIEGRLYRITGQGQGKVWYDAPETHLRSIAVAGPGRILVGGSGEGRIYEVTSSGGRALYDSSFPEISTIFHDERTGVAWAAGVTNVLPTTAPARTDQNRRAATGSSTTSGTAQQGSNEGRQQEGSASATVDVSFSFDDGQSAGAAPAGAAELYRIDRDGFVEPVRKFDRELIYALTGNRDGALFVATGPQGRVYEYRDGEFALIAAVPEKQLVSFSNDGGSIFATTTNSGAVYRLSSGNAPKAEFRSATKDTGRFSSFGHYRVEGQTGGSTISFRSGNTSAPDETWSDWSAPKPATSGNATVPAARYVQWRVNGSTGQPLSIDSVSVAFLNRNVAPVIESVIVNEPAVVFIGGNYPSPPQVVEATNPDEYGIFTSLDETGDRTAPGKKYFRRGYRTVSWKASDPNGDTLRYTVMFRRDGSSEWLRLRENIDDSSLNFDTSQLPDGSYEIKVTATDGRSNPQGALSDSREGVEMLVDNTAPRISSSRNGDSVSIRISDDLSPVAKAEYSVDAKRWVPLVPEDGIPDSKEEVFRLPGGQVDGKFVVIRAVDTFYNVSTEAVR